MWPHNPAADWLNRRVVESSTLELGTKIAHKILEKGRRWYGVVYKAEDANCRARRLMKSVHQFRLRQGALDRFNAKPRPRRQDYPHICTVHDIDEYEGQPFIVMEFLRGETLKHPIARGPLRSTKPRFRDSNRGRSPPHMPSGSRRDIKPANIFITTRASEDSRFRAREGSAADSNAVSFTLPTVAEDQGFTDPDH